VNTICRFPSIVTCTRALPGRARQASIASRIMVALEYRLRLRLRVVLDVAVSAVPALVKLT